MALNNGRIEYPPFQKARLEVQFKLITGTKISFEAKERVIFRL